MANGGRASWQREQPAETPTGENLVHPGKRARSSRKGEEAQVWLMAGALRPADHPEVMVLAQAAMTKDCRLRAAHGLEVGSWGGLLSWLTDSGLPSVSSSSSPGSLIPS